ncbi:hypothetical protein FQA39_LY19141 [Lamprigera yunnana]|nr:hypothetical protein FQA39_LY19141 [Lamprigera yunnana]
MKKIKTIKEENSQQAINDAIATASLEKINPIFVSENSGQIDMNITHPVVIKKINCLINDIEKIKKDAEELKEYIKGEMIMNYYTWEDALNVLLNVVENFVWTAVQESMKERNSKMAMIKRRMIKLDEEGKELKDEEGNFVFEEVEVPDPKADTEDTKSDTEVSTEDTTDTGSTDETTVVTETEVTEVIQLTKEDLQKSNK